MKFIDYYDENYADKHRNERKITFRKIFELLGDKKAVIVETGTARTEGNWRMDGQSTIMFDKYVQMNGGEFYSIDNDQKAIATANRSVSDKTVFLYNDGIIALHYLASSKLPEIDLLYLDSFTLDQNNFHPSALHHLKELAAIMPKLKKGTIIVVDDNKRVKTGGKGTYVQEFLEHIGAKKIFDDYQLGFIYGGGD